MKRRLHFRINLVVLEHFLNSCALYTFAAARDSCVPLQYLSIGNTLPFIIGLYFGPEQTLRSNRAGTSGSNVRHFSVSHWLRLIHASCYPCVSDETVFIKGD
jgi:hypothetical protein